MIRSVPCFSFFLKITSLVNTIFCPPGPVGFPNSQDVPFTTLPWSFLFKKSRAAKGHSCLRQWMNPSFISSSMNRKSQNHSCPFTLHDLILTETPALSSIPRSVHLPYLHDHTLLVLIISYFSCKRLPFSHLPSWCPFLNSLGFGV